MERFYKQFKNCIQKEVPFCQASCPFHLEVVDFIEKAGRGAFSAAYKTYRNAVTFPAIVAALCPEPCKTHCIRAEEAYGGNAIELRGLERAIIEQAKNKDPIYYNVPRKNRKIAIIGAGISGLGCAFRLASKKYDVEVFEASGRMGGHLWEIADGSPAVGGLTPEIFLEEFELQLKQEQIPIHFHTKISSLEELAERGYEAIYVATGAGGNDFGLLDSDAPYFIKDNVAYFAGGSLTGKDTIEALADGINIAAAIEIYLKTGNLSAPDDRRTTNVQVDPCKLEYRTGLPLDEAGKVKPENIAEEANRCLRCQCDSCKIYCDLVAYTQKWPLRIKDEVQATMHEGKVELKPQPAKRLINICTHCGLCKEVCPAQIDLDSMFLQARKELHKLNRMPWAFHDFWLRDMDFADGEAALVKTPPGVKKSKFAFFPGCQLGASEPRYVADTYSWLLSKEPTMGLFLKCCGTPVKWAGDEEKHAEAISKLHTDWEELGKPKLVVACPSCMDNISEFLPDIEIISLYEFMEKNGVVPAMKGDRETWSIFDPCASAGKDDLRKSIRNLAESANFQLEPLPVQENHSACCSYGGHVSVANPKYADFIIDRRITESENPYITYCINCRDAFLGAGKKTIHILDVIFGDGCVDGHASLPTVTERRENRIALKEQLLKNIWGEEMAKREPQIKIDLKIDPELKAKLNREWILEEEVADVIEFCERTGRKVILEERGTFSGYRQVGRMTYWVEYRKNGESFELVNAYSHRMKIELEAVWDGKKVDTDM